MSLSFVLAGLQIKRFKTVVKALAAIGMPAGPHAVWLRRAV